MRILYSTSRIALRDQCLREVCGLTETWPDRRAMLIVPEQTKMDVERDYLAMSGQSSLMMAEVLSFRRLAWRLLGEVGRQPRQTVDAVGQGMLIHNTLTRCAAQLHSFGHLADKPGFIRQAAAALGDLRRYQIGADQLMAASDAAADQALRSKTNDLAVLLRGYDAALSEVGLCDAEDDLNRLGDLLQTLLSLPADEWPWPYGRLTWLRQTSVWISGFGETRDFTPQEDVILQALNQLCSGLTLTVAADLLPFDWLSVDSGTDCCLPGRKTVWRLLQDFPGSESEKLPEPFSGNSAVIADCFRQGRRCGALTEQAAGRSAWLRLVRAGSRDAELAWVAGEIRRLVQLEGYRYRDITLAVCDLPGYTPRLRSVCREYGIPLFLDAEKPLSGTPLMRFVLALLDLGLRSWPAQAVMACLRSGMTTLSQSEIDLLENNLLAKGFIRPDQDPAFAPWQAILADLKKTAAGAEKCRLLRRFLVDYGLRGRIEQRSGELAAGGEMDSAVSLVQAWNELDRIFEQMIRLAGDAPMPLQTFRDLLAAGMEAAGGGVIPTAIDQVTVGSLKQASLRQPRVLFLIGTTAALLPPGPDPEGLLKDQDRQTLSGLLACQLPSSARDQVFADAFVLYTLLTLPSDRLCLTSPEYEVSLWFAWLAAAAPWSMLQLPEQPAWDDARLNATRPAFGYLLNHCSRTAGMTIDNAGWLAVGRALKNAGLPLAAGADWLRRSVRRSDAAQVHVSSELVRSLYAQPLAMSVSQLEKYASCPFLHLASYLLALQERPVWQPEAAETGTLLHGVFELAMTELRQELAGLDPADSDGRQVVLTRWLQADLALRTLDWMKAAADRDGLQRFFDNGLRASAGYRVRRLAAASLEAILRQYQREAFLPSFLEWNFGPDQTDRLALALPDGRSIDFRGIVDRIDLRQETDGARFRVIDYKSGDKKVDYDALFHGLALQLPAYLEAFAQSHPGCLPEDAAYFHFDRPIMTLPAGRRPEPADIQKTLDKDFSLRGLKMGLFEISLLRRHTLRKAGALADQLLQGDFAVAPRKLPGKDAACKYCLMKAVCGFDGNAAGFCWLEPLHGRPQTDGKMAGKRQEMILRLLEESGPEGGAADGTHA